MEIKLGRGTDLRGVDLSGLDLNGTDLSGANLEGSTLKGTNLRGSNMKGAKLKRADFRGANLSGVDLSGVDLSGVDLRGTNLSGSDLSVADFYKANLEGANLTGANLYRAILEEAIITEDQVPQIRIVPREFESLIGFKKACLDGDHIILKLKVIGESVNSTSRKCRCSRAITIEALDIYGSVIDVGDKEIRSIYDYYFTYTLGKEIVPDKYDPDFRKECSNGIHFFLTFEEARDY